MKNTNRDSLDFGKMNIPQLFVKLFIPTLIGMIFMTVFNIVDGIFVGKGISSDALAAVNISAPVFLFSTAASLMFASGVSIVAAEHLAKGNVKAANINVTQSMIVPLFLMLILSAIIFFFPDQLNTLFGGSEILLPYVRDYLRGIFLFPVLGVFLMVGSFIIRLDGAPKVAMSVNIVSAISNIFLDWLFIFPLGKGIWGAAVATIISEAIGAVIVMTYLLKFSKTLHFYRLKISTTSLYLTLRNSYYMMKLGFPTFIGEVAIAATIIVGNYMFIQYLHEDGVAAFSVACYLFPLIFIFGNAIAQSQLPILSYNNGIGSKERIKATIKISVKAAAFLGILMSIGGSLFCDPLITLFLNHGTPPHAIAMEGFPYFATGFVFISLNLVGIGIYQGLSKANTAIVFMFLRGIVLVIPSFLVLPKIFGTRGLWLAQPVAETLTLLLMIIYSFAKMRSIRQERIG